MSAVAAFSFHPRRVVLRQPIVSSLSSSSSSRPLLAAYRSLFAYPNDDSSERQRQHRRRRLYCEALPQINVITRMPHTPRNDRRWFASSNATTPPVSRRADEEEKESTSTTASDHATDSTEASASPESRYSRERLRQQAGEMRDRAQAGYRYVRDHPKESATSFGIMLRRYGPVFIGTYLSVYFATLGSLFLMVESGIMDPAGLFDLFGHGTDGNGSGSEESRNTVDLVVEFMRSHSFTSPYAGFVEKNPAVANLAVAWIAVKFTEPARLAVALSITPRVARTLGYSAAAVESEEAETEAATAASDDKKATESGGSSK